MSKHSRQLEEDRALRNSARRLFAKELKHVRAEVAPRAIGERMADRVGERAEAASDSAIGFAESHWGKIAAAGGAFATAAGLWLARKPILSTLAGWFRQGEGDLPDDDREFDQLDEVPDNE